MFDNLGDRMKAYESVSKTRLVPKMPVIARFDGKAFHTLTRRLKKPYDPQFQGAMWAAAVALCEEIQGAKLAYVQSDEISVLLVDYASYKSQPWFDYEVQKMCSVGAATASVAFNADLRARMPQWAPRAVFDARFWNLPMHEVCNYFIWRQNDAARNSLQGLCQSLFSHQELHGKGQAEMHEMLHTRGLNWNDCSIPEKRGVCVVHAPSTNEVPGGWFVDEEIPIFSQNRTYIDRLVDVLGSKDPPAAHETSPLIGGTL
jgi:tRNA(His) guanylyltransferase